MILKYQSGQLDNERYDETSEREGIVRYSKSKPDDFLRCEVYEHDGRFWTDEAAILKGWKAGHPGLQFWELAGPPPIPMPKISGWYFWP